MASASAANSSNSSSTAIESMSKLQTLEEDDRPSSILECMDEDGNVFDHAKFLQCLEKDDEVELAEDALYKTLCLESRSRKRLSKQQRKHYRRVKSRAPHHFDEQGQTVFLQPRQTVWCCLCVRSPPLNDDKFQKKFRRRFRMPHDEHQKLLELLKPDHRFARWVIGKDCVGKKASPIELLVLGALRYLGRGLTFDDLEEYTAIHEETHRQFFHTFIDHGAAVLHPMMVKHPTTAEEHEKHVPEFAVGGLPGAGFSIDATNVVMWRCQHNLRQMHMGFKQSHPARSCNLTTNHRREIPHTAKGHPCRWNDKTLAYHDEFMTEVHDGKILQDVIFTLLSRAVDGTIVKTKCRGAWGLVDNGCHKWACAQAPGKSDLLQKQTRVSEWIESFRKDAECVFGILKGRFRTLKTGIRLEGPEAADNVWPTCCALHNWLLRSDGLADKWLGALGENEVEDVQQHAPFAMQRLKEGAIRQFGGREHERHDQKEAEHQRSLANGKQPSEGEDIEDDDENNETTVDGATVVNSLSYDVFRERLVENFDMLHRQRKCKWPVRRATSSGN